MKFVFMEISRQSIFFSTLKVRAGVEMAVIDAVASSIRVPLWRLFGGASNTVTTDITVKILYNLREMITMTIILQM